MRRATSPYVMDLLGVFMALLCVGAIVVGALQGP